jgi:hypothetical protein
MRWYLPWVAARSLYGPYTAFRRGEFGAEARLELVPGTSVRIGLDPLLRILVPVRLWFSLGVVVVLVKLWTNRDLNETIQDVFAHGVVTMVLGPFGVALGAVAIVLTAGRGRRAAATRQLVRPAVIAAVTMLLSVGVFGLQLQGIRQPVQRLLEQSQALVPAPLLSLLGLIVGPWLLVFGVCAVFLMHRNGFATGDQHPLLRPIVTVWLALMVAAVQFTVGDRDGVSGPVFVAGVLSGPLLVIGLSLIEVIRLRRLVAGPTPGVGSAAGTGEDPTGHAGVRQRVQPGD